MRTAHDWGRALGRPRTSATVSRKSFYLRAIICGAAAALAACDKSPISGQHECWRAVDILCAFERAEWLGVDIVLLDVEEL